MLQESGIDPSRMIFEITENEMIANLSVASGAIKRLQNAGIRFGLDDFGSGFSSLSYLQSLPIDFIKVDGSFTRNIAREPFQQALIRAVEGIADVLKIGVAAEFVETTDELAAVRALGVRYAQGHLLGRPRETPFTDAEINALLAPLEDCGTRQVR
jgi:EAL domain-containing protein (putative c-di-GMP-specific phosphodiesterase class I)